MHSPHQLHRAPGPRRQLRLPVPAVVGAPCSEPGAGQGWAGLGHRSAAGGPFLPATSAAWPDNCLVASAATEQRPGPSCGFQEVGVLRCLSSHCGDLAGRVGDSCNLLRGLGPAGHPQDATPVGEAGALPHRPARCLLVTAHHCWTGASSQPRPLLWPHPGCGHGRHSPCHQDPAPRPPRGGRGQRGLLAGSQGWAVSPVQQRPLLVPWRGLRRGSWPAQGGHRPRGLPRRGPGRPRGCPHPAPAAASRAGRRARGR